MSALETVIRFYRGSDGEATKALYERLTGLGPLGIVATNLFRAQKNSERAKAYRGRAIGNLCAALAEHGLPDAGAWGWGEDDKQPYHRHVLYIDLPTGQVSFHTGARGDGPDYPRAWDGVPGQSADRIIRWCARLLDHAEPA